MSEEDASGAVSSTIYGKALESRAMVVVENTMTNELCAHAASLAPNTAPRTVLCCPLVADEQIIGALYLDRALRGEAVAPPQFELFGAVTGFAAELLGASETRRKLLAATDRVRALNSLTLSHVPLVHGDGPASRRLVELIDAAAAADVNVLVTGETGTGKEVVACQIHRLSARNGGPFIPVNCAALPPDLVESELFGVEKGAFTGATQQRIGRFELASTGTLFLDEIGELTLDAQVKLLRALQERSIVRVGGSEDVATDFRLICATNQDLEAAVQTGDFRRDLYFRIRVFPLPIVPLRERPEDILPLAHHFLEHFSMTVGRPLRPLTSEAERLLESHRWPGNVRELRNAIERAVVFESHYAIRPESLPINDGSVLPVTQDALFEALWAHLPQDYKECREILDRAFLVRCLRRAGGNVAAAARAAGMTRHAIYRRLAKLDILPER